MPRRASPTCDALRRVGVAGGGVGVAGACAGRPGLARPREGVPARVVGRVGGARIRLSVDGRVAVDDAVADAESAWASADRARASSAPRSRRYGTRGQQIATTATRSPTGASTCSTSSRTNAACSGSSAIRRPRTSPTSGSTRCSTAARRARASPRPTACASACRKAMGYVNDVFDSRRAVARRRVDCRRARPLLDGRREPAGQRPADRHRQRPRAAGARATTATWSTPARCKDALVREGAIFQTSTDSEVVVHLFARSREKGAEAAIVDALAQVRGAYLVRA